MKNTIILVLSISFSSILFAKFNYPLVKPVILRQIPHYEKAFSQGLVKNENLIYESTGLFNKSTIRVISEDNGDLILSKKLPDEFFGEGLTILNEKLYQLTWKSGIARVYSLPEINLIKSIKYTGEGWGLTAIGDNLVMSNGSSKLQILTNEFERIKTIDVRYKGYKINQLNELEYANGKIYANKWKSNYIFEIDYPTGTVTKVIDCSEITKSISGLGEEEVLNGIAFNEIRNSFYITGKNWPLIFEVTFPELTK
jgi:glutamine cyclotransferase